MATGLEEEALGVGKRVKKPEDRERGTRTNQRSTETRSMNLGAMDLTKEPPE
jgi:hypothetical protein